MQRYLLLALRSKATSYLKLSAVTYFRLVRMLGKLEKAVRDGICTNLREFFFHFEAIAINSDVPFMQILVTAVVRLFKLYICVSRKYFYGVFCS